MYIKQSNRVGIEAVRATSRGQRKPRNSLPQSNKENNVISNWPLLPARWDHTANWQNMLALPLSWLRPKARDGEKFKC